MAQAAVPRFEVESLTHVQYTSRNFLEWELRERESEQFEMRVEKVLIVVTITVAIWAG